MIEAHPDMIRLFKVSFTTVPDIASNIRFYYLCNYYISSSHLLYLSITAYSMFFDITQQTIYLSKDKYIPAIDEIYFIVNKIVAKAISI